MNFIIQIIIIVVLVGLGYYGWQAWKRQSKGRAITQDHSPSVSEASIEQVRVGGTIQLPPHGEAMETKDVQVTARHVYEEDGFQWFELEGDSGTGTVWLEGAHDDELETSVTLERLGLDDIGLTAETLQQLGQGGAEKTLAYGGRQFEFAERGRANFRPAGDATKSEVLDYWDFEGDDDKHDLGIEGWDGQYRVYLSQRINPARIKIYSLGDST
ncbi:MAG: DUF4178 domain-containing protein [Salinisphaera sp.]|nr:DUF4178 domain-containing protein [Salinisphaera sp.]